MARYSQLDAAYQVLRLKGRPMNEGEIRDVAIQNGFFRDASVQSLRGALYSDIRAGGRFIRVKDGFGLREWSRGSNPAVAAQLDDESLERALRQWLRALHEVNAHIKPAPSADTLCLWVEVCYRFGLKDDAVKAFRLIAESDATPWLFERARRFYRLCQRASA